MITIMVYPSKEDYMNYKKPHTYRVSYDLKYGTKQYCVTYEAEVDTFSQREAIRLVKEEVAKWFGKHAFHCKARRV